MAGNFPAIVIMNIYNMRLGAAVLFSLFAHVGLLVLDQTPGEGSIPTEAKAGASGAITSHPFGGTLQVTMHMSASVPERDEGKSIESPQIFGVGSGSDVGSDATVIRSRDTVATSSSLAPSETSISVPLPGNVYFRVSELDERPQIQTQTEPQFPLHVDPGVVGVVVLKLLIDQRGAVEDAIVISSKPEGVFDAAAVAEFRKAKFQPGKKAGRSVKTQLAIEVVFESRPFRE